MIQFDDPADERNFYVWEVDGVFEQTTNPELFADLEPDSIFQRTVVVFAIFLIIALL